MQRPGRVRNLLNRPSLQEIPLRIPIPFSLFKEPMILNSSALETLAAFAIAFFGGIVCGLALIRYGRYVREDARRGFVPA